MNRIRGYHVAYAPRQPIAVTPDAPKPVRHAAIDAAIIAKWPTARIIAELGANNETVQLRKRRLRKQGRIA